MSRRRRTARILWAGLAVGATAALLTRPAAAAPQVDLHDLTWHVHVDLVEPDIGRDLAFWQDAIDAAVTSANQLLEGGQGPFDTPCCTRLGSAAQVVVFGSPGDGLDVLDSESEQILLNNLADDGSHAFLIDSLTFCGGSAPNAVGCAELPGCSGNGNDDPNLWMAVTVDSFESGTLPSVIAHERGHNSCLPHVTAAACQIMQPSVLTPGNGGCLAASECTSYRAGRTQVSSGLACGCHADAGGAVEDGSFCSEVAGGVCSGGLCGSVAGDAGVRLMAAADPGSSLGGPPEEALAISGLKGDWRTLDSFSPTAEDVHGLAFARDSGVLYGVVPSLGDDRIVTIDPETGRILQTVGLIANGSDEILSMAYDPGATSSASDDRLIVLELSSSDGQFRAIDPAAPSQATLLGAIPFAPPSEFRSLAYDSIHQRLYSATAFINALFRTDLSTCPPSPCTTENLAATGLSRTNASLSFSPETGMLYLVGTAFDGQRTFYDVIDPATGTRVETVSLDVFAPAALAVVPEPGLGLGVVVGGGALAGLGAVRRRRARRSVPVPVRAGSGAHDAR